MTWTTRFLSSQLVEKALKDDMQTFRNAYGALITVMPRYREAFRLANEAQPDRFFSRFKLWFDTPYGVQVQAVLDVAGVRVPVLDSTHVRAAKAVA